jgi:hypothetical protein
MHHVIDKNGEHIEIVKTRDQNKISYPTALPRRSILPNFKLASRTIQGKTEIPEYAQSIVNSDKPPAMPLYEKKGDMKSNIVGLSFSNSQSVPLVFGINSSSF